jgi:hypothetical protein
MATPPPPTSQPSLIVLESGLRLQQLVALRLLLETEVELWRAATATTTTTTTTTTSDANADVDGVTRSLYSAIAHAHSLLRRSVTAIDAAAAAALASLDNAGREENNNNSNRTAAVEAAATTLARANSAADDAVALVREVVAHVRTASERLGRPSTAAPAAAGATESQIGSMPSHIVGGGGGGGDEAGHDDCSVCLSAVVQGQRAKSLDPCGHTFHAACIDAWMRVKARCPLCVRAVGFPSSASTTQP